MSNLDEGQDYTFRSRDLHLYKLFNTETGTRDNRIPPAVTSKRAYEASPASASHVSTKLPRTYNYSNTTPVRTLKEHDTTREIELRRARERGSDRMPPYVQADTNADVDIRINALSSSSETGMRNGDYEVQAQGNKGVFKEPFAQIHTNTTTYKYSNATVSAPLGSQPMTFSTTTSHKTSRHESHTDTSTRVSAHTGITLTQGSYVEPRLQPLKFGRDGLNNTHTGVKTLQTATRDVVQKSMATNIAGGSTELPITRPTNRHESASTYAHRRTMGKGKDPLLDGMDKENVGSAGSDRMATRYIESRGQPYIDEHASPQTRTPTQSDTKFQTQVHKHTYSVVDPSVASAQAYTESTGRQDDIVPSITERVRPHLPPTTTSKYNRTNIRSIGYTGDELQTPHAKTRPTSYTPSTKDTHTHTNTNTHAQIHTGTRTCTHTKRIPRGERIGTTEPKDDGKEVNPLLHRLCMHLVDRKQRKLRRRGSVEGTHTLNNEQRVQELVAHANRLLEKQARKNTRHKTGVIAGCKVADRIKGDFTKCGRRTDARAFDNLFSQLVACRDSSLSPHILRFLATLRDQNLDLKSNNLNIEQQNPNLEDDPVLEGEENVLNLSLLSLDATPSNANKSFSRTKPVLPPSISSSSRSKTVGGVSGVLSRASTTHRAHTSIAQQNTPSKPSANATDLGAATTIPTSPTRRRKGNKDGSDARVGIAIDMDSDIATDTRHTRTTHADDIDTAHPIYTQQSHMGSRGDDHQNIYSEAHEPRLLLPAQAQERPTNDYRDTQRAHDGGKRSVHLPQANNGYVHEGERHGTHGLQTPGESKANTEHSQIPGDDHLRDAISPITGHNAQARKRGQRRRGRNPETENSIIVLDEHDPSLPAISEQDVVRDVIYLLQGIDGEYIKFVDSNPPAMQQHSDDMMQDGTDHLMGDSPEPTTPSVSDFRVDIHAAVDNRTRRLIRTNMAPVGLCFKYLETFINSNSATGHNTGIVYRSLVHKVQTTLSTYYNLIATLQDEYVQDCQNSNNNNTTAHASTVTYTHTRQFTLKHLYVWCHTPAREMAFLCGMVENSAAYSGGTLLSALNKFTDYGDPQLNALAVGFVGACSSHVYSMMSRWVYDGAIEDPFFEFFVKVNADISDDSDHAWREKHVLDPKLVPNCVPLDTARTILLVGKSVYFIRQRCGDSAEIVPQEVREGGIEMFKYGQPGGLQSALDQAYSITGARLLDIMHNKFRLSVHMVALKKYLLLAQGDFVQALMENVDRELSCPAEKLYLHNLASTIQTAAQATTVKYEDAEVLERLDVRLEQVGREASTGYDLFLLDYHVHGPVNVVFTGTAMHQYHRLFRQLWRLKRLDKCLSIAWLEQNDISKRVRYITQLTPVLHRCNVLSQAMKHFVSKMQYYLMVEVIEASSETLRKSMQKAKDLDQVIDAHNKFLSEVVTNSLLGDVTSELFAMIKTIAGNILGFCQFLENFRAVATQEHTTRQQAETDRIERGSRGEWATSRKDTAAEEEKMAVFSQDIKRFSSKVSRFNNNFRSRAKILVELLNESQSPSMRSLATRLDFSGYFSSVKQSADGFQSYSDAQ